MLSISFLNEGHFTSITFKSSVTLCGEAPTIYSQLNFKFSLLLIIFSFFFFEKTASFRLCDYYFFSFDVDN